MSYPTPLICDECGKQMQPYTLPAAHDCDGGEALRKAAHELFAPTVDLIERTIAKAGTGVLRGVFELAAERDQLRKSLAAQSLELQAVRKERDEYKAVAYDETQRKLIEALGKELQAVREALGKYGDHYPECVVIQDCGNAVKPACTCGFDAALKQSRGAT